MSPSGLRRRSLTVLLSICLTLGGSRLAAADMSPSSPSRAIASQGVTPRAATHQVTLTVLSIYVHDDGDAFPYGCGEGYSDWNDPYSSRIAAEGIGMLRPDNGHGWTGHLQSYCSDTNYVMPGAAIPNVNWRKGSLPIGAYVDISVKFVESDGGGPTQWVEAVGAKLVTVPKVGAPQDFVISAEGSNGGYGHVRMDYHLRLSTS